MIKPLIRVLLSAFVSTIVLSQAAYAGCGAGTGSCVTLSSMVTATVTSAMFAPKASNPVSSTPTGLGAPVSELSSDLSSGNHTTDKTAQH